MRFIVCLIVFLTFQNTAFCQQPSLGQIAARLDKTILVNGFVDQGFLKNVSPADVRTTKNFIGFLNQNGLAAEDHNRYLLIRIGASNTDSVLGVSLEDTKQFSSVVLNNFNKVLQTDAGRARATTFLSRIVKRLTPEERKALEGDGLPVKDLDDGSRKYYNHLLNYTLLDGLRGVCSVFSISSHDKADLTIVFSSGSLALQGKRKYPDKMIPFEIPLQNTGIIASNRPITERSAYDDGASSVGLLLKQLNTNTTSDLLVCDPAVSDRPIMLFHPEKMSRDQAFVALKQLFQLSAVQKQGKRILVSPAASATKFSNDITGFQNFLRAITPQPWLDSLPGIDRAYQTHRILNEYAFRLKRDKVSSLPLDEAPPLIQACVMNILFDKGLLEVQDTLKKTPQYIEYYDESLLRMQKTKWMGMSLEVSVGRYNKGKWQMFCSYSIRGLE